MNPIVLIPVGLFAFLGGAAFGRSRKGLSMTPPEKMSPLRGIRQSDWERFVSVMVMAPRERISPRGRLGMFQMDARRLSDIGAMINPHKATVGGETGVWTGEWKAPLSQPKYLGSLPLQYAVFVRSMKVMVPKITPMVGTDVGGMRCSLSGLLGVGHLAGEAGVESWVKNVDVRRRFPATTANFQRTNGIF